MTEKIEAPWTGEQVKNLNLWQIFGRVHPFTCGNNGKPGYHSGGGLFWWRRPRAGIARAVTGDRVGPMTLWPFH